MSLGRASKSLAAFVGALLVVMISLDTPATAAPAKALACDQSLKSLFKPDALTTVVAVKAFK